MNVTPQDINTYRQQLREIVDGLSAGDPRSGFPHLAAAFTHDQMTMFVEGNVQKRVEKLSDALVEIADAFDDLESLIDEYVTCVSLPAYATSSTDSELFLQWLPKAKDVSPELMDVVRCEQARHEVERQSRDAGVLLARFQEVWSPDTDAAAEVDSVILNPVRVSCVFRTVELLDESWSDELPVTATFYRLDTHCASRIARSWTIRRLTPSKSLSNARTIPCGWSDTSVIWNLITSVSIA